MPKPVDTPSMTIRSLRVPDELWQTAMSRAAERDEKVSEVLREALEAYATAEETLEVTGDASLPVGDLSTKWDGAGATDRIFEMFTGEDDKVDTAGISKAFLFVDTEADPATKAAYKLPFADVVDGALTIIPAGVIAAAGALAGGRGGVDLPDEDRAGVEKKVCSLYAAVKKVHDEFGDCPVAEKPDDETEDDDMEIECSECQHEHDDEHDLEASLIDGDEAPAESAAIFGYGRLSESEDPETQALVNRARELLLEGAVGVSIKHDMNPDDMPDPETIQALQDEERFEELEALMSEVSARPRHVAVVDTAAFSNSRLTANDDGTVSGPVAFEGKWTGDIRRLPYGTLTWDDNLLPIPITMGHEGPGGTQPPVIGYIDKLERMDGWEPGTVVTEDEVEAVTAAAGFTTMPARYFDEFKSAKPMPLHVDAPDAFGLRRIWGHAAPKGVCHRSDMGACFQFPGDVDPMLREFHTGAPITLDNGKSIRVGALTMGGLHVDAKLSRQGVGIRELNRHREDSRNTLAMVHAWEDVHGLAVSGVVPPDVTPSDLMRALACAPSVELWPSGRGRTTVGIHLVPTPAWPVVASVGEAMEMASTQSVEVDDLEAEPEVEDLFGTLIQSLSADDLLSSLKRIEGALALLVTNQIDNGVEVPDEE